MTEGVWIAIIATVGVISTPLSGVLVAIVAKQGKTIRTVRNHVENSHVAPDGTPYNLRDNIDDNQSEIVKEIRGLRRDIGRVDTRTLHLDTKVSRVSDKLSEHIEWSRDEEDRTDGIADRVDNLEDTLNVRKKDK